MEHFALGLKNNWKQFSLLVLVNAFVGGMVGIERNIFPELASTYFGIASTSAMLSFIIAFGISKAAANYFTGRLANKYGRKKLLVLGWVFALPVPFILLYADQWFWVVFANVLLGINQGFAWSSTVVMKIDLVGEKDRGFAMGLNEFAGYLAVGLAAFASGYLASQYGVRPLPFYLGIGLAVVGLLMSIFIVKDTRGFVELESKIKGKVESKGNVFLRTTILDKTLSSVTQAGLINNLNDGMVWGLLPLFLFQLQFSGETVGILTGVYPAVWGLGQLFTGKMADSYSRKKMLFWGMLLQGCAILVIPLSMNFGVLLSASIVLGCGTALVYPTFLTTIASSCSPVERTESIGVFRLWRDLGYAIGAVLSGVIADVFGIEWSIVCVGCITLLSAGIIQVRMPKEGLC